MIALRTRNITATYRRATDAQRLHGQHWYQRARDLATELDTRDPSRAAAVIAVLSPRVAWPINVRLARQAYAQHAAGEPIVLPCLGGNARKVARILAGEDPEAVVSGPKVRAFWRTIADPTDPRAVVVDRHAFDVAAGRVTDDATRGAVLGRTSGYDGLCDLYRRAAVILSRDAGRVITPSEVQAVTWTAWRETQGSQRFAATAEREQIAA